jgi:hypothetical protein
MNGEDNGAVVCVTQSVCANCHFWRGWRQSVGGGWYHVEQNGKGACKLFLDSSPTLFQDRCAQWSMCEVA